MTFPQVRNPHPPHRSCMSTWTRSTRPPSGWVRLGAETACLRRFVGTTVRPHTAGYGEPAISRSDIGATMEPRSTTELCQWGGCSEPADPLRFVASIHHCRGGLGFCAEHDRLVVSKIGARRQFGMNTRSHAKPVYALRVGDRVKIGRSGMPRTRVERFDPDEWYVVETGESEGELQIRFWDQHLQEEWFRYEGAIREWFDGLCDAAGARRVLIRGGHVLAAEEGYYERRRMVLCRADVRGRSDVRGALRDVDCRECVDGAKAMPVELLETALAMRSDWIMDELPPEARAVGRTTQQEHRP